MSGCDGCDEAGPDETRRAFHDFGRAVMANLVEPWAVPVVKWLSERMTRA